MGTPANPLFKLCSYWGEDYLTWQGILDDGVATFSEIKDYIEGCERGPMREGVNESTTDAESYSFAR